MKEKKKRSAAFRRLGRLCSAKPRGKEVAEEYSPRGNIFCYERKTKQYDFYLIAPLFSRSDRRLTAFSYL